MAGHDLLTPYPQMKLLRLFGIKVYLEMVPREHWIPSVF
jgi:hypothetical protein